MHRGVCDIERFALAVKPLQLVAYPSFEHVRRIFRVKPCLAALFEHVVGDQSSVCGQHADPDQRSVDLVDAFYELFLRLDRGETAFILFDDVVQKTLRADHVDDREQRETKQYADEKQHRRDQKNSFEQILLHSDENL